MRAGLRQVLLAIAAAREALDGPRGPRQYPDGTAWEGSERAVERLTERRERRERERRVGWADLLLEASALAVAAPPESDELEARLSHLGALVTAWLEDLRARRAARARASAPPPPGTVLHVRVPPSTLVYRATVRRDGLIHVSALSRAFHPDDLHIQRTEEEAPAPPPSTEPLRPILVAQLEAMRRGPVDDDSR